jgi:hypothetical protein
MLSTRHQFSQTRWTRLPRASRLVPRKAAASCLVPDLHLVPRAMCRSHLARPRYVPLTPRASCCAQPRSDLRAMASSSVPASSFASTSAHWGAASRWEHVETVCFMRFIYMLYMFHLDIVKVDLVLHMLQWLYTYVANVCFKYFSCLKRMLQVFFFWMLHMLHCLCVYVASVCFICFKKYVANILSGCCIYYSVIHICCKCML